MLAQLCRVPRPSMSSRHKSSSAPRVLALTGCTAAGKSRVASEVAASIGGELVSVDSVKLYRGFDIGSNKAALLRHAAQHGVPTHLVDVASATLPWSAGDFVREARRLIADIHSRGSIPILVGGTSLYLDAVLGTVPLTVPPSDPATSHDIKAELASLSWEAALARLAALDPVRASQLTRNDRVRLARALEVARASSSASASPSELLPAAPPAASVRAFVISSSPRSSLYRLSDERCEHMLRDGLVTETLRALASYSLSLTSPHLTRGPFSAIGYSHVIAILSAPSPPTRTDAKTLVLSFMADTRHLARRQLAWWRRERIPLVWSDARDADLVREVVNASALDSEAWQRYVRSEAIQARNGRLKDENDEGRRALRAYIPDLRIYDERTESGRASLDILHKELSRAFHEVRTLGLRTTTNSHAESTLSLTHELE